MLHADAAEHSSSAASILAGGYDAVSLDLFSFGNWFRACGRWEGTTWVQMYPGSTSDSDYKADVLRWVQAYHAGLLSMARPGSSAKRLLLVPNHASHVGQITPG